MPEYGKGRQAGQRNMYVVGAYKKQLLDELRNNPDFQLALLGSELSPEPTPKQVRKAFKHNVFDYAFTPGTTTEERIFTCIEVTCPYADGITWKNLYIHVYVFTPKMSVAWNEDSDDEDLICSTLEQRGYIGNKIDMVVDIIDRKINGFENLALGKIKLASREGMGVFSYIDGYYGKQLTYEATDFNLLPPEEIRNMYTNGELDG